MQALTSEWSIVLVGSWNVAILNPNWLATEIYAQEQVHVDVMIAGMNPAIRVRHGRTIITPHSDRVTISCTEATGDAIAEAEQVAVTLLRKLPVTPLAAIGANFAFTVADPPEALTKVFNFNDRQALVSAEASVISADVVRKMSIKDQIANLRLQQVEDGTMNIYLNFHTDVLSSNEAVAAIDNKSKDFLTLSLQTMGALYGVEMDAA